MYIDREEAVQMAEVDKYHPMFAELGDSAKDRTHARDRVSMDGETVVAPQIARAHDTDETPESRAFLAVTQYDGPDGKT